MSDYTLSFKPAIELYGTHDPSAAIFEDGSLVFGIEEERLTRQKHATGTFPSKSIQACLDHVDLTLQNIDRIVLPYDPSLYSKQFRTVARQTLKADRPLLSRLRRFEREIERQAIAKVSPTFSVQNQLRQFGEPLPEIVVREHHACHAASAFHPSGFDKALVLSIDGTGEYDSTVVWNGDSDGLKRIETYPYPNSLGHFYGVVTEYLGYNAFNGEGKIMGLAPYGSDNPAIEDEVRGLLDFGVEYDVTPLTKDGIDAGVDRLEAIFSRPRNETPGEFEQWHRDLAHTAQKLLEETVTEITRQFSQSESHEKVCLAGGVALNCKMNKRIMELDCVEDVFIQPVAHDAGLAVGGGFLEVPPESVDRMDTVYWGPSYESHGIRELLETKKIRYREPDDLESEAAAALADGQLVGWFRGRLEMGPRALGHRSILADPRTAESRDRVNRYVKHREEWRPFAPSMHAEAVDEYLVDACRAPYMIRTFDVREEKREELSAVLHPADDTTRPQTVTAEQNPSYHRLIDEFQSITGVPVLLNSSFNDNGEPIVNDPAEALKDFYGMGLDILVLEDLLVEKE